MRIERMLWAGAAVAVASGAALLSKKQFNAYAILSAINSRFNRDPSDMANRIYTESSLGYYKRAGGGKHSWLYKHKKKQHDMEKRAVSQHQSPIQEPSDVKGKEVATPSHSSTCRFCCPEELSHAVRGGDFSVVKQFFEQCSRQETERALQHRTRSYGTPLGIAVEQGNVSMTRLIVQHTPDEQINEGRQCAESHSVYCPQEKDPDTEVTATSIALRKCAEKWEHGVQYPCEEILQALHKCKESSV